MKVAIIGAGSIVFAKTLLNDMLGTPSLSDGEYALMSRTEPKLRRMEAFANRMIKENGLSATVWATARSAGSHQRRGLCHLHDPSRREAREMAGEMIEAEAEWLPQFRGKKLRPTPSISVPKGVKPAEVPLDPALAIGKRFMTLIQQKT